MKKALGSVFGLIVVIGLVSLVWVNRYSLYDDYRLFNYHPPSAISNLASQTTMTPYAKELFYSYHPVIESSTNFNKDCKVTEQAIVLGCTSINNGIWLFSVNDSQLNGVEQVTAAHEMLHVAYSRLSGSELKYINGLLTSTYNNLSKTDPLLKSEYDSYMSTEGASAVVNELHSVLGTEVSSLPPALESYYSKYFTDRKVIVGYASTYEGIFTSRQQQVQQDDQQLSTWQQQINTNQQTISIMQQQVQAQQSQLNQLKSSGQFTAYNNKVDSFNNAVNGYNSLIDQTKLLINNYNQLVGVRNSLAVSENKLIQSISSLPSSIKTQ